MENISIIVSISNNGCIGNNNKLPWEQSNDLKRFKSLTLNHIVIMGRKTYESIDSNLSDRINIVITKGNFSRRGCYTVGSISESLELSAKIITEGWFKILGENEQIFFIGGGEIYKQVLPIANKLYITRIDADIEGDTYFPDIDETIWKKTSSIYHEKDEKNEYNYTYEIYELV